tara:strand:- start:372 stop:578 length:207 start_codon:yes stop_codon:yes gene_type:complete
MFIIKDWAGNRYYPDKAWKTLEDAFDFLLDKFPDDEDVSEFYILRTDSNRFSYHFDKNWEDSDEYRLQ